MDNIESVLTKILENLDDIKRNQQVKDFMTVGEASEYLGVPRSTMYQHSHKRTIAYYKTRRRLYFKKADLDKFISTNYYRCREQLISVCP